MSSRRPLGARGTRPRGCSRTRGGLHWTARTGRRSASASTSTLASRASRGRARSTTPTCTRVPASAPTTSERATAAAASTRRKYRSRGLRHIRAAAAGAAVWAVMSSPLHLGHTAQVSPADAGNLGAEEVIAVNQESSRGREAGLAAAGVGGDCTPLPRRGHGHAKAPPGGAFALAFVSNGDAPAGVACDRSCYSSLLARPARAYTVRDLWARRDLGTFAPPQTLVAKALAPATAARLCGGLEPCAFKGGATWVCRRAGTCAAQAALPRCSRSFSCREAEANGSAGTKADCGAHAW